METLPASQEVALSFLHPHGPSPSFKFPYHLDTLFMHCQDVLTVVEPVTETGRVYKISPKEMESATKTLMERNPHGDGLKPGHMTGKERPSRQREWERPRPELKFACCACTPMALVRVQVSQVGLYRKALAEPQIIVGAVDSRYSKRG